MNMTFKKTRTELRKMFTRLVPQVKERGYKVYLSEAVDTDGDRFLNFSISFKDEKQNWHVIVSMFLWEKYIDDIALKMDELKTALKNEGFKL